MHALATKATPADGKTGTAPLLVRRCSAPAPQIQRKLSIGAANDPLEHEADRIADQVMRMAEAPSVSRPVASPAVPATMVRAKSESAVGGSTFAPPVVHAVLDSPGHPLDAATRAVMEPRFGHDFSQVQVHTDAQAAESARAVGALAYTVGSHIALRSDRYRPETQAGHRLIAHELAHVVQQSRNGGAALLRRQPGIPLLTEEQRKAAQKAGDADARRAAFGGHALRQPQPIWPHRWCPCTGQDLFPGRFNPHAIKAPPEHNTFSMYDYGKSQTPKIPAVSQPLLEPVTIDQGVSFRGVGLHFEKEKSADQILWDAQRAREMNLQKNKDWGPGPTTTKKEFDQTLDFSAGQDDKTHEIELNANYGFKLKNVPVKLMIGAGFNLEKEDGRLKKTGTQLNVGFEGNLHDMVKWLNGKKSP